MQRFTTRRFLRLFRRLSPIAFACVTATALGVVAFAPVAESAPNPPVADAPTVSSLTAMLEGFNYTMTHVDVTRLHDQVGGVFDREYNQILMKMQPGTRMQAMEAERDKKKAAFAASFLEFTDTPLGFDTTGLVGEYSYKNHEYIQILRRDYGRRFFFYMGAPPNDHFWKLYDEVHLCDGCAWGKSYQEAVMTMNGKLGVVGRARKADAAHGYSRDYTEWQDGTTHLRVVDRSSEGEIGIALASKTMEANLSSLRSNKMEDPFAMDPSVAAATRGALSDPNSVPTNDAGAPKKKK